MPGFDGTGPRGRGPMTGRGMGYCAVPLQRSMGSQPSGYTYGNKESEMAYLKDKAQSIREQIRQIEAAIDRLGKTKSKR